MSDEEMQKVEVDYLLEPGLRAIPERLLQDVVAWYADMLFEEAKPEQYPGEQAFDLFQGSIKWLGMLVC